MITTNDLRIGNIVLFNDEKKIISVINKASVSFDFHLSDTDNPNFPIEYKMENIDKIFPIPITKEIISSCGFEKGELKHGEISFWWDGRCVSYGVQGENEFVLIDNNSLIYVHQLQNLYFAITGEELIIKI